MALPYPEAISLAQDLIRIRSINPPGAEAPVVDYISDWASKRGFETRRMPVEDGRENLLLRLSANRINPDPPLVFTGHMDVVPVRESELKRWSVDPFAAEIIDGWLWGRGAADMKGGLACALTAFANIAKKAPQLKRDLVIAITCDEEFYMKGSRALIADPWLPAESWLIVCEPTDLTLCRKSRGRTWAEITLSGKTAHGSRPDTGVNTIELASRLISRMSKSEFGPNVHARESTFWQPMKIKAGIEPGIVPDKCTIEVDCRISLGCNSDYVWQHMRDLLEELKKEEHPFEYEIRIIDQREPWETAEDHPLIEAFRQVSSSSETSFTGSTDANVLRSGGLVPIICGPGSLAHAHRENERVKLEQLMEAVDLYTRLINQICL